MGKMTQQDLHRKAFLEESCVEIAKATRPTLQHYSDQRTSTMIDTGVDIVAATLRNKLQSMPGSSHLKPTELLARLDDENIDYISYNVAHALVEQGVWPPAKNPDHADNRTSALENVLAGSLYNLKHGQNRDR